MANVAWGKGEAAFIFSRRAESDYIVDALACGGNSGDGDLVFGNVILSWHIVDELAGSFRFSDGSAGLEVYFADGSGWGVDKNQFIELGRY